MGFMDFVFNLFDMDLIVFDLDFDLFELDLFKREKGLIESMLYA